MGYSTTQIEVKKALAMTRGWSVFEASGTTYFYNNKWRRLAVSADISTDRQSNGPVVKFDLKNGDFVTVEKGGK